MHRKDTSARTLGMTVDITPTPEGEVVWSGVRSTWLALRSLMEVDEGTAGAFKWTPERYRPVVVVGEDGRGMLAFRLD